MYGLFVDMRPVSSVSPILEDGDCSLVTPIFESGAFGKAILRISCLCPSSVLSRKMFAVSGGAPL